VLGHLTHSGWNSWPSHKIRDGEGREEKMLSFAGHLRSIGVMQDEIEVMCLKANDERYEDSLDEEVVLDRARRYAISGNGSISQLIAAQSKVDLSLLEQVDRTDAGNAALLFNLTNGEIRFVHEFKTWIVWHNGRWHYDRPKALIHTRLLLVSVHYQRQADKLLAQTNTGSLEEAEIKKINMVAKAIGKWAELCRNKKYLD
jgi:hypothetical protein